MTSSTVKDRVERRVSRISELVGKSAFSSIFEEKTELKNELKRFSLLAEPSNVLPLPSNFTGSYCLYSTFLMHTTDISSFKCKKQ